MTSVRDSEPGTGSTEPKALDLQDLLLETQDVADFLDELACYAAATLSSRKSEVFCGITLLRHGEAGTVASSGEKALMLDELQYQLDEGPCLMASRRQLVVHIPDLASDTTFPDYNYIAMAHGVRSVLALPFHLPENSARAGLNLYSETAHALDGGAVERAQTFVAQAAKGLRLALLLSEHSRTAENLKLAMTSRTVIDTAVGIVIAQNRCTQDEAFAMIKAASNHRNIKLRDVAASIVESAGGGKVTTHFA
ncbi:GAF and ANTAR domain-containing protein [Arthrobacter sp. YD4]|uniref:GAF and ANTAR domain-containing protein n=1 Tax=Arthrobacter sp. YD4 TaxID=3058043 RepID=UPI0025B2EAA0|nr:GAF and ANTAR domain-containing protein [Arthrobacter sp. YD4]MDN3935718.1 GAF and ANTAR domain-containing protein [Arthrobacter sp. YD4]